MAGVLASEMTKVSTRVVVELSAWMAVKVAIGLAEVASTIGAMAAWMVAMVAAMLTEVAVVLQEVDCSP